MQELGKYSSAIFYDQRGTGKSSSDNAWQSDPFETYVRDVEQLREAFGYEKVSLLAHSWGGVLASLYALAYPQRVDEIIYMNPVPLSSASYMEFVKHRTSIVDSNKDKLNEIRKTDEFKNGDPAIVEKYYRLYFKNYFSNPELANSLTLTMSNEAAINNFKIYDLFFNFAIKHPFDLYHDLKALNKSSLIVACDKDVIPLHYMDQLHESIPASEFILINNSGHFPYIDQPDILFKAIREYLTK
jgi:proline iminopeptidase